MTGSEKYREPKKKILHVIDALNYGGAQQLLLLIAASTARQAYHTVVCSFQENDDLKAAIESSGARVYVFYRHRPSILRPHRLAAYIYRNIKQIHHICRQHSVDVIHCHLSDAEFIGILAGRLAGVRRILTTVHYPDLLPLRRGADPRTFLRMLVTRILYSWVNNVVAVSAEVAHQLKSLFAVGPSKLRVTINRIDIDRFANVDPLPERRLSLGLLPGDRVLCTVARLMPPKGHAVLLVAMRRMVDDDAAIKLLLVGDGDLKPRLQQQCRELDLENNVLFLGSRDDVPELLAICEIFVLPSLWEGTSLALLEAMAAKKPIVCTDIPGNEGLLGHGRSCLKVPVQNPVALAEAIKRLLDDPHLAQDLGAQAYGIARRRFDIRTTMQELEHLWGVERRKDES